MKELNNPYRPGSGLFPPFFAGRKRELGVFQQKIENTFKDMSMHMALIGDWATGKTTLLKKMEDTVSNRLYLSSRWRKRKGQERI